MYTVSFSFVRFAVGQVTDLGHIGTFVKNKRLHVYKEILLTITTWVRYELLWHSILGL